MAVDTQVQKIYQQLINYLAEKGEALFVADLPKQFQDLKILNVAWIEGMVEFGKRHYVITGEASHDSRAHVLVCLVEDGISWTGPKRNIHKPLKDLLAEDNELPMECRRQRKVEKKQKTDSEIYEIVKEKVPNTVLRLQIRITDKGYAAMAA